MNIAHELHTYTLGKLTQGDMVKRILSAALDAADPDQAVRRNLIIRGKQLQVNKHSYQLDDFSRVYLLAVGKAAPLMASAAQSILGKCVADALVITKHAPAQLVANLRVLEAGHPIPDERSLRAGQQILDLLAQTTDSDLVIFLISGGGSALMTAPVDGVSLADMEILTAALLGCGARIDEINTLRRALDRIKGGGLARAAAPARTIGLLLSDVVDSPLEAIASGPTVPNPTTRADALAVLEKYDLLSQIPGAIMEFLRKKEAPSIFAKNGGMSAGQGDRGNTLVIGSNIISAKAAWEQANREGFDARILTTSLQGEAAQVGRELAMTLRGALFDEAISLFKSSSRRPRRRLNMNRPLCLIAGGETTVTLGDAIGHGGRNQELALAAVAELAGLQNVMLVTLATDGEDGPTDAAGAVVTGDTLQRAQALGFSPDKYLRRHDAYPFFDALGDLLKPGSTGTNVNDLTFLFAF